ncbi:hypothetical protein SAMN06297280_2326 [Arsukibacterium tuosuense]|uniref:Transmembrane protein n=1 Tax=Arsukibacterium tuosuense TaxID=1323745 RepID=A0A285J219_9GAMM|nr:hypothetical protein [Arsukibacterium tuosuense]SNY53181.1 hypothetical protein SAMN06297280_2326 [Arsukibacterium tuosuense]
MDFYFNNLNSDQVMAFGLMWNVLPMIGALLVHLAFSAAVFNDAKKMQTEHGSLAFVNCWLWSLAVLVGGVFVALAYWVMHHSTIAKH